MCILWTVDFSGLRINYDFYKKPGALASCFARFGTFHGLVDLLTSLSFFKTIQYIWISIDMPYRCHENA